MNDKDFDKLIKSSLKKNMDNVKFTEEMKSHVLKNTVRNKFLYKIKKILNYKVEIPLAYVSVASLLLISVFGYNISEYFPDPEEISSFQMEWIFIKLNGGM